MNPPLLCSFFSFFDNILIGQAPKPSKGHRKRSSSYFCHKVASRGDLTEEEYQIQRKVYQWSD